MKIKVNGSYYVEFDGNQYTPWKWRKGGEEILKGINKGKLTEPKWSSSNKYFMTLPYALEWIVEDSLQDEYPEIDLKDFISAYQSKMDDIYEACKGLER